jgi:hypothetical protein
MIEKLLGPITVGEAVLLLLGFALVVGGLVISGQITDGHPTFWGFGVSIIGLVTMGVASLIPW